MSKIDISEMPIEERIALSEALWDSLLEESEAQPIPDWHAQVLEERDRAHEADPSAVVDWEVAKASIRNRLK